MGIDYNCYLGPYIECKIEKVIVVKTVITCTNEDCLGHGHAYPRNQRHCVDCGSQVGERHCNVESAKVDTWEIRESINEDLMVARSDKWEDYDVWILNRAKFNYERNTEIIVEVTDTHKEIEQFVKDFEKQIETIVKNYKDVKIKWGMILWMS